MARVEDLILSDTEKTFQYDKDLLTLPVPDLGHTLKKYLESVRPHVTDEEYKQTEFIVQQFATGEGKYLQEKLKEKAKHERNWLAEWWDDIAYLEVREPRPMMNMAGPGPYHEDVWPPEHGTLLPHAALALYYTLKFWLYIRQEKQKPMKDAKGRPLCMYQFRRVFNTCNIPGVHKDKLVQYFKTESEGPCPSHVLVTSKGHIFILHPFDDSGELLTPLEIEDQLRRIRDRSKKLGPAQGVPFLTSQERTAWAEDRNRLVALHPKNSQILTKIESAIMGVWLEEGEGGDMSDLANRALLGNGENRWFDKSLSSGAYENGMIISNADHTPAEGMMMVYITSYVHAKLRECQGKWQGTTYKRPLPEPEHEQFVLDDHLVNKVEVAKKNYDVMKHAGTAILQVYDKFGKNYCKQIKIHPDVFCQLGMQLGYYSIYGNEKFRSLFEHIYGPSSVVQWTLRDKTFVNVHENGLNWEGVLTQRFTLASMSADHLFVILSLVVAPTYETAPIKQFYHGRTETMRSATMEVKAWCTAMADASVSNAEKFRLLLAAADKHNRDFADACEFRACDRHLLGLYIINREEERELPLIFKDPSFVKSGGGGNFLLSTSCIGYTTVIGAVLPMCENGIGTFYRINDEKFTFYITTWNADKATSSTGYGEAVCTALDKMRALVDQNISTSAARL